MAVSKETLPLIIEGALHSLVNEFLQLPFATLTESDTVVRFHQLLDNKGFRALQQKPQTQDLRMVALAHAEYNLFSGKGHYDTVILNPAFVEAHLFETVANIHQRDRAKRNNHIMPLQAALEFKFSKRGRRPTMQAARKDLDRLRESGSVAQWRYFVFLMRECNSDCWDTEWRKLLQAASRVEKSVCSIFATYQLDDKPVLDVQWFGPWQLEYERRPNGGAVADVGRATASIMFLKNSNPRKQ